MLDSQLFDRDKALACFGSPEVLKQVLQQFLEQAEPMLDKVRTAAVAGDREEIRKAVHWFRGGMSYLFSPAAEELCLELDQLTQQEEIPPLEGILSSLETVLQRLQDLARKIQDQDS